MSRTLERERQIDTVRRDQWPEVPAGDFRPAAPEVPAPEPALSARAPAPQTLLPVGKPLRPAPGSLVRRIRFVALSCALVGGAILWGGHAGQRPTSPSNPAADALAFWWAELHPMADPVQELVAALPRPVPETPTATLAALPISHAVPSPTNVAWPIAPVIALPRAHPPALPQPTPALVAPAPPTPPAAAPAHLDRAEVIEDVLRRTARVYALMEAALDDATRKVLAAQEQPIEAKAATGRSARPGS